MWVPARTDDALRSTVRLACAWPDGYVKAEQIAVAEARPLRFLENVLADLRRAGIVRGRRGAAGGYTLTRAPDEITVLDIVRAVGHPIVEENERDERDDNIGALWAAVNASACAFLASRTLADLAELASEKTT